MVSGIVIKRMCSGLFKIFLFWKEKIIISVKRSLIIVILLNFFRNIVLK